MTRDELQTLIDTIVSELKEVGANTTRCHYLLPQGLLDRFDKAGIMVWNEAPVWQRDSGANLCCLTGLHS